MILATAGNCPLAASQRVGEFDFGLVPGTLAGVAAVRAVAAPPPLAPTLPAATLVDTTIASFQYDADGRRVQATVAGVTTVYPFEHYEVESPTVRKYYASGGQRVAVQTDGALSYLLTDHLGSTSVSVDASGAKTGATAFRPYGATRYVQGALPTDRLFTGQPRYGTLGLDYFGARWYDNALGRWSSPDPLIPDPGDPQSLNRYSFASNNPVRYVDRNGHCGPLTPVCLALLFGGMALLLQGDSPDLNITPEDVASQRLGGALFVGGATLAGGTALAGVGPAAGTAGTSAATAACADGNCLNEVQETERIVRTGWTVIGKYPAYLEKARQLGANALNDPIEKWNALGSRAAQWARNVEFLDEAIARGDSFRLATPFAEGWKETGTFYKDELIYLLQKGYELGYDVNGAEWLIKVK